MKPAKPSQAVDRAQLRRQRSAQGLRLRAALEFLTNIPLEPHAQRKDEHLDRMELNVPYLAAEKEVEGQPGHEVVLGALKNRPTQFARSRSYSWPLSILYVHM